MWPLVINVLRTYAPYVTLPAAAVIGFIGRFVVDISMRICWNDDYMYFDHHPVKISVVTRYNIEKHFRTPPPSRPSIEDQRNERLLKEVLESEAVAPAPLSEKKFVPKTIFEKNVSPSLVKDG